MKLDRVGVFEFSREKNTKADKLKPKIILIEGTKNDGLGIAIMNRLLRTCEYDFLTDK